MRPIMIKAVRNAIQALGLHAAYSVVCTGSFACLIFHGRKFSDRARMCRWERPFGRLFDNPGAGDPMISLYILWLARQSTLLSIQIPPPTEDLTRAQAGISTARLTLTIRNRLSPTPGHTVMGSQQLPLFDFVQHFQPSNPLFLRVPNPLFP
ncbi:hypothetical protein VTO42DRAFT_5828 [Malbranchea cinnamomea]